MFSSMKKVDYLLVVSIRVFPGNIFVKSRKNLPPFFFFFCQNCIHIPYNGIFSRRQIFAVLSKKTWGLFFADFNIRGRQRPRKLISFFSAKIVEWVSQLEFPFIDQLCGKKNSGQNI